MTISEIYGLLEFNQKLCVNEQGKTETTSLDHQ